MSLRVGYVGLGAMGGALAQRLLLSRCLHVFDLKEKTVGRFVELGGVAAATPADLGRDCDVVLLCLPRSANVREAIFGARGLLEGLTEGKFVIDQTSGDPNETRRMADDLRRRGVRMLDAPVSGGVRGASAGTISIMVGGDRADYEAVAPVFADISPNVTHCGDIGAGQVIKLINNTISTCNRFAMLEGVAMGIRNGIDPAIMQSVLNAGGARSRATENLLATLVAGKPRSDFALALMLKDLNLSVELAIASGTPLPFGELARTMLQAAANTLGPNALIDDIADVVAGQARINGFRVAERE